jgi:CRISPR-associated protein Cmr5
MRTREQEYAVKVYEQVKPLADLAEKQRKKYGGMAHKLPILIRTAGLAQALAFVEARGDKEDWPYKLLNHIAEVTIQSDATTLLKRSREDDLVSYMRLTQQVLDALLWYKRFAQSVLDVQTGEETGDDE